jgi:nucleoside-diphosphate-sugar epimerase
MYNVAETEAVAEAEWVRRIGRVVGWRGGVVVVPKGRMENPLFTEQHWDVDSSRIREELGYSEVIEQEEGLRRTVEYERANPPEGVQVDYGEEDAILQELEGQGSRR